MDVAYVNPFVASAIETFKTMMDVEISPGAPLLKKGRAPTHDVSGIIGLSGLAQGSIALSFPEQVALKVVAAMVKAEITTVGPEITDGIGELANIIAGYAKLGLGQFHLKISLPEVVLGKDHAIVSPTGVAAIVVPFESPFGPFVMEVALKTP